MAPGMMWATTQGMAAGGVGAWFVALRTNVAESAGADETTGVRKVGLVVVRQHLCGSRHGA